MSFLAALRTASLRQVYSRNTMQPDGMARPTATIRSPCFALPLSAELTSMMQDSAAHRTQS